MKRERLAFIAFLFCVFAPFAGKAEETKTISRVSLEIEMDYKDLENVEITERGEGYLVSGYEYTNSTEEDSTSISPRLRIYLEAEEGYQFKNGGSSYFTIKGKNVFRYADSSYKGRQEIWLYVDLKPEDAYVGAPADLHWSQGGIARWKAGYKAQTYELNLLENGRRKATRDTSSEYKDFSQEMTPGNSYSFRICSVNSRGGRSTFLTSTEIIYTGIQASGGFQGIWLSNALGWRYVTSADGSSWCARTWKNINGSWYRFDENGYMAKGWFYDPALSAWYYLKEDGSMATGWEEIQGKYYFFHQEPDARQGVMYANTYSSDGYALGEDGAWK